MASCKGEHDNGENDPGTFIDKIRITTGQRYHKQEYDEKQNGYRFQRHTGAAEAAHVAASATLLKVSESSFRHQ